MNIYPRLVAIAAVLWFSMLLYAESMPLAGRWTIRLDTQNQGMQQKWQNQTFDQVVSLPGVIQAQGYGDKPSLDTQWIGGSGVEKLELPRYAGYKNYMMADDYRHPFWLTPDRYFRGAAWYQKKINIPDDWAGKHILLKLERCHWESTVFIDEQCVGADSSLSTPHIYDLSQWATPGEHTLTIRIVNDMIVNVGQNAHSISDHTQSNWNGIVGEISLIAEPVVAIKALQVYPDVAQKLIRVRTVLRADAAQVFSGRLVLRVIGADSLPERVIHISGEQGVIYEVTYPMGKNPKRWDEFQPNLYTLNAQLVIGNEHHERQTHFGMRDVRAEGTRFHINGRPIFLRGTLDCCVFPKTGHPPMQASAWKKIFAQLKRHGLNHMRFHSWCPPEAAFVAADSAGFYLQVEGPFWVNQGATLGDGKPIDAFIYKEIDRILDEYGNHPSFCMMAYGNEPAGTHQKEFLGRWVEHCQAKDPRHLYTSASGWPPIPESDYQVMPAPRLQQWGQGLGGILNGQAPRTDYDWRDVIQKHDKPVIGHEIGQWCVYPHFNEVEKYTGYLKPKNFDIFYDLLKKNHMGDQAEDFFMASGKLQALCYKAEIEAALRTPGYAGFQLLDIHDFPGQGTALVGILDPFYESKPYINATQFHQFCGVTVPLARMEKRVFTTNETFSAQLEAAHFGEKPIADADIVWSLTDHNQETIAAGHFRKSLAIDNCQPIGDITVPLKQVASPQKLRLEVSINESARNVWEIWVYPEEGRKDPGEVIVADRLSRKLIRQLENGASVLLQLNGKIKKERGAKVAVGFSPVFWNTAWTNDQAPHTLGILCDPQNPLFADFPTEYHSNWQWWDVIKDSQAMILDGFPPGLRPKIQLIDTWFYARRLGLLFEARVGDGRIVVTSIDFSKNLESRPAKKQLLKSLLDYMNSNAFSPDISLEPQIIADLYD